MPLQGSLPIPVVLCLAALPATAARAEVLPVYPSSEVPPALAVTADDFRPDNHGFLLLQSKPYNLPTEVVDTATIDSTRLDFRGVTRAYDASLSESLELYHKQTGGDVPTEYSRDVRNYWVRGDGKIRNNNSYTITYTQGLGPGVPGTGTAQGTTEFLNGYEIGGFLDYVTTLEGLGRSHYDDWYGFTLRDVGGSIALLRQNDHEYVHYVNDPGTPSETTHTVLWRSDLTIKPYSGLQLPSVAAAGLSESNQSYPVVVFASGSELKRWDFSSSGVVQGTVAGFTVSAGMTFRACAEKAGELVVIYELGGQVHAWSSLEGDASLGAAACNSTTPCYTWYDDTGAVHVFVGELVTQSGTCATHSWRSPAGDWSSFSFASSLAGETITDMWFDMGELKRLKVAVTSNANAGQISRVRYFQFESGTWSSSVVSTTQGGRHFDHVSTGSTRDGSKLLVYREDAVPPRWFLAQAGGTPPAGDIVPVLLGFTTYVGADDINGDGIGDAADTIKP